MTKRALALLVAAGLALGACGDTWGERAASGGGIGAAAGLAVGAATGGLSLLGGALIGGALGAGVGVLTMPKKEGGS